MIIWSMFFSTTFANDDTSDEYMEKVYEMSWESYYETKKLAEQTEQYDEIAFKICKTISESEETFFKDDSFCKLSKKYKDWVWFELPGGGNLYCPSKYAVNLTNTNNNVVISNDGCSSNYRFSFYDGKRIHNLNGINEILYIDGKLYNYTSKDYNDEMMLNAFGNAKTEIKLIYAVDNEVKTAKITINGSSAALRFLGY